MHNQTQSSRALGWDTNDYVSNTYRGCANLSSTTFTHTGEGRGGQGCRSEQKTFFPALFSSAFCAHFQPPDNRRLHGHGGLRRPGARGSHHPADQPRVPESLGRVGGAHPPCAAALQQPRCVACRQQAEQRPSIALSAWADQANWEGQAKGADRLDRADGLAPSLLFSRSCEQETKVADLDVPLSPSSGWLARCR